MSTFGGRSGNGGVGPQGLVVVGETVSLTAWDEEHGGERWRSDGTPEGTIVVKDIRPGPEGSGQRHWGRPAMTMGDTLYFAADDGVHGLELWRSDGTLEGTTLVRDIVPGPDGSSLRPLADEVGDEALAIVGETLYFRVWDGQDRAQLWRTDGTPEGTVAVPHIGDLGGSVAVVGGTLFFTADNGEEGWSLWRTDGDAARTTPVQGPPWSEGATVVGAAVVGRTSQPRRSPMARSRARAS